jgi:hypothetical protein
LRSVGETRAPKRRRQAEVGDRDDKWGAAESILSHGAKAIEIEYWEHAVRGAIQIHAPAVFDAQACDPSRFGHA